MADFHLRAMEASDHTEVAELICASMNVWDILHGAAQGRFTGGPTQTAVFPDGSTPGTVSSSRTRGRWPFFLLPVECSELVRLVYKLGGRNVEMHAAQVRGDSPPFRGVSFPTFMPETG
jgi:hypothetical protein